MDFGFGKTGKGYTFSLFPCPSPRVQRSLHCPPWSQETPLIHRWDHDHAIVLLSGPRARQGLSLVRWWWEEVALQPVDCSDSTTCLLSVSTEAALTGVGALFGINKIFFVVYSCPRRPRELPAMQWAAGTRSKPLWRAHENTKSCNVSLLSIIYYFLCLQPCLQVVLAALQ